MKLGYDATLRSSDRFRLRGRRSPATADGGVFATKHESPRSRDADPYGQMHLGAEALGERASSAPKTALCQDWGAAAAKTARTSETTVRLCRGLDHSSSQLGRRRGAAFAAHGWARIIHDACAPAHGIGGVAALRSSLRCEGRAHVALARHGLDGWRGVHDLKAS